jgi:hypothetical protein
MALSITPVPAQTKGKSIYYSSHPESEQRARIRLRSPPPWAEYVAPRLHYVIRIAT